ncbi:unnamed protein product [Cercospora beticola]|nr:unnamed protein product [Cercospora beticola]
MAKEDRGDPSLPRRSNSAHSMPIHNLRNDAASLLRDMERPGNLDKCSHCQQILDETGSLREFLFHFLSMFSVVTIFTGWAILLALSSAYPEFACEKLGFMERASQNIRLGWIGAVGINIWFTLNLYINTSLRLRPWLNSDRRASAQVLILVIPVAGLILEQYVDVPRTVLDCSGVW